MRRMRRMRILRCLIWGYGLMRDELSVGSCSGNMLWALCMCDFVTRLIHRNLLGFMDQRQLKQSPENMAMQCFPRLNTPLAPMSMRSSLHSRKNSKYGCPTATSYSLHLKISSPLVTHHLLPWPPSHIPLNPGMESNSTPKSLTRRWALRS